MEAWSTIPLAGVRAIANIAIMVHHCMCVVGLLMPDLYGEDPYEGLRHGVSGRGPLTQLPLFRFVGLQALEWFFLLTGLLATLSILPALESIQQQHKQQKQHKVLPVVARFYGRRVMRIVPAHVSALVLTWLLVLPHHHQPQKQQHDVVSHAGTVGSNSQGTIGSSDAQGVMGGGAGGASTGYVDNADGNNSGVVMLAKWFPQGPCTEGVGLWRHLLFAVPPELQCNVALWSLWPQVLVYAALPPLLLALRPGRAGFRSRVLLTAGLVFAASSAARVAAALAGAPFPTPAFCLTPQQGERHLEHLRRVYQPTALRLQPFALGAALALLLLPPSQGHGSGCQGASEGSSSTAAAEVARRWLLRHRGVVWGAVLASLAVLAATLDGSGIVGDGPGWPVWKAAIAAICYPYGPVVAAAMAVVLAAVLLRVPPLGPPAAALLSHRFWRLPARLSYSAYLLHMQVLFLLLRYAAPGPHVMYYSYHGSRTALCALAAVHVAASFAAAWVHYYAIERGAVEMIERLAAALLGTARRSRQRHPAAIDVAFVGDGGRAAVTKKEA